MICDGRIVAGEDASRWRVQRPRSPTWRSRLLSLRAGRASGTGRISGGGRERHDAGPPAVQLCSRRPPCGRLRYRPKLPPVHVRGLAADAPVDLLPPGPHCLVELRQARVTPMPQSLQQACPDHPRSPFSSSAGSAGWEPVSLFGGSPSRAIRQFRPLSRRIHATPHTVPPEASTCAGPETPQAVNSESCLKVSSHRRQRSVVQVAHTRGAPGSTRCDAAPAILGCLRWSYCRVEERRARLSGEVEAVFGSSYGFRPL